MPISNLLKKLQKKLGINEKGTEKNEVLAL
jgi:hypothetical protein